VNLQKEKFVRNLLAGALLTGALCSVLLFCIAPAHAADSGSTPAGSTPPAINPALEKLGAAITFYTGFDSGALAELSAGTGAARDKELVIETKPGLWGQAFFAGEKVIAYDAEKNVDLSRPGALAVWVSPYEWQRAAGQDAGYLFFAKVLDQGREIMLARMGDVRNNEAVYAYAQAGEKGQTIKGGSSLQWKNGEWHLLAVNWSNTAFEISLDGGTLQRQEIAGFETAEGKPGQLFIGSKTPPDARYLMDELMILNRPLSQDEIKALWESKAQ
jgi:hypothetical protein